MQHIKVMWLNATGQSEGNPTVASQAPHMSYSLNSSKGGYIGDYIGDYYRGY